ncbi:MAG: hypothetical protein ACQKBV_07725 [Puniceicoccales bacterium]
MELNQIITLASKSVEPLFHMMERSLRATGCDLPLRVIPFSESRFDLPENSEWWEVPEFLNWIDHAGSRPVMRKYQVLLASNFHFVDTDVIFLRDPREVLAKHSGWINSCSHWQKPGDTLTVEFENYLRQKSSVWQWQIFNTGQFACDRQLYDVASLKAASESPELRATVLENPFHEQPGINFLVHKSGVPITNLTLPPHVMESTWAGDYPDADFRSTWRTPETTPYLIHWAGRKIDGSNPIDELALGYLNDDERKAWLTVAQQRNRTPLINRIRWAWRAAKEAF